MRNKTRIALAAVAGTMVINSIAAQTLPVGTPLFEENWRRMQISGKTDLNRSFSIRPLSAASPEEYDSMYVKENIYSGNIKNTFTYLNGKGVIRILPVLLKQQYVTHHPYGWNDGSMIPAKGYQAQFSAGIYSKIGPLTIQLRPELVYAQNKDFATFPASYSDSIWRSYYNTTLNQIDNPEKYGNGSYTKFFPGQSSIRFNYKKLALGVSTENLWWGPGIRNSLLMSNNAPGFGHISFNTTAPVLSPVGSFEWQVISGILKNSNILPPDTGRTFDGQRLYNPKLDDSRYLNGMIITWQPKWTRGLHLGFTRVIYQYKSEVPSSLDGYLPIIGAFFKGSTTNEDEKRRDQMLSLFFRLVLPKENAEVYGEFGRNDHSQNSRDLLLEPEHSRAYIIGFRKLFDTKKEDKKFELLFEITHLQTPSTRQVREMPTWYVHHQVRQGYTNLGQVIGAGIGPGASSQTIGLNWVKGVRTFGLTFERVVRNNDFYYDAFTATHNFGSHWVDLSLNAQKNWYCKNFIFSANLSLVRSLNYQWRHDFDANGDPVNRNVNNLNANLSVGYLF